jgi:hypothetical protein
MRLTLIAMIGLMPFIHEGAGHARTIEISRPLCSSCLQLQTTQGHTNVLLAEDTDAGVDQVPPDRVGPAGNRIPEVGPPPPKTEGTATPNQKNTADCTGANADSTKCYTATHQGKGK